MAVNRIAVLDTETSDGFDRQLSDSVSRAMRSEIAKIGNYAVVDPDNMNRASGGRKCQVAPYSSDCFVELGHTLQAEKIVTGKVVYFNGLYYFSFQIVTTKTGKVDNIAEGESSRSAVIEKAQEIAAVLVNKRFYFLEPHARPDWRSPGEIIEFAMGTLETPGRDDWQQPRKVVDHLPINPGDAVAEIGGGTGYFTSYLSRKTGPRGTVYAVDIEKDMLDVLDARAKKEGLGNVRTVLARPDKPPPLPPASMDTAFLCEVYFAIPDKISFLKQLGGILKRDGKLVIVDFHKPPGITYVEATGIDFGPDIKPEKPEDQDAIAKILTVNHYKNATGAAGIAYRFRVPRSQVIEEATKSGFRLSAEHHFLPYQYFLVFSKDL
jgi:ubiquinone/menaquinone biosynthesis C-methylase UbiE